MGMCGKTKYDRLENVEILKECKADINEIQKD